MARPQKSDEVKRDSTIEVRVTSAEKNSIRVHAKEQSMTMSDFLRTLALNTKPLRKTPNADRELLLKHLAETNKIGSNLNQIARVLNQKTNSDIISYGLIEIIDKAVKENDEIRDTLMEILSW